MIKVEVYTRVLASIILNLGTVESTKFSTHVLMCNTVLNLVHSSTHFLQFLVPGTTKFRIPLVLEYRCMVSGY